MEANSLKKARIMLLCFVFFGITFLGGAASAFNGGPLEDCQENMKACNEAFESFLEGDMDITESYLADAAMKAESLIRDCNLDETQKKATLVKKEVIESFAIYLAFNFRRADKSNNEERRIVLEKIDRLKQQREKGVHIAEINHSIGMLYHLIGRYDMAEGFFAEVEKDTTGWALLLLFQGKNYRFLHQYEKAIQKLEACLLLSPERADAYIFMAYVNMDLDQYNKSFSLIEKALQKKPGYLYAYLAEGWAFEELGQDSLAEQSYKKAIELDDDFYQGWNYLAWLYKGGKQYDQCLKTCEEMIRRFPKYPHAYDILGDYYEIQGDFEKSIAYSEQLIQLDSTYLNDLALTYSNMGDKETALKLLEACIAYDSTAKYPYYNIGDILREKGKIEESIPYVEKALELDPQYDIAANLLAASYEDLAVSKKDIFLRRKALSYRELACKLDPNDHFYIGNLGYSCNAVASHLFQQDSIEAAFEQYSQGAKIGNEACKFAAFGLMYEYGYGGVSKDYTAALKWYTEAAKRVPVQGFGMKGILRLYESEKVLMDTVNYNYWKEVHNSSLKKFTIPVALEDGRKFPYDIYIYKDYPEGVHPLEWESRRLYAEWRSKFPEEVSDSFQKLLALARKNDVSFPDLCVYALEAANEEKNQEKILPLKEQIRNRKSALDSLQESEQRLAYYNEIAATHEEILEIDASTTHKENAAEDYQAMALFALENGWYEDASKAARRGLQLDTTSRYLARYLALSCLLGGNYDEAEAVYLRFKDRKYYQYLLSDKDTYADRFIEDLARWEKIGKYHPDFEKARLLLFRTRHRIENGLLTFEDLARSKDQQVLLEAANYYEESEEKEDWSRAAELYARLRRFHDDVSIYPSYMNVLLKLEEADLQNNKFGNEIEELYDKILSSQNYSVLNQTVSVWLGRYSLNDPYQKKLAFQSRVVEVQRRIWALDEANETYRQRLSSSLVTLGYYQCFNSRFQEALASAEEGLRIFPAEERHYVNIATANLFLGKYDEASAVFQKYAAQEFPRKDYAQTFGEAFIKALQLMEREGLSHPGLARAKRELSTLIKDPVVKYNYGLLTLEELLENPEGAEPESIEELTRSLINDAGTLEEYRQVEKQVDGLIEFLFHSNAPEQLMDIAIPYREVASNTSSSKKNLAPYYARLAIGLYERIFQSYGQDEPVSKEIASRCGGFAYTLIKFNDYEYGLRAAQLAHQADETEQYAITNMPLALLLLGRFEEAKKLYLQYKDELFTSDSRFETMGDAFLVDFEDLESQGITHPDFDRIRTLLKN